MEDLHLLDILGQRTVTGEYGTITLQFAARLGGTLPILPEARGGHLFLQVCNLRFDPSRVKGDHRSSQEHYAGLKASLRSLIPLLVY